MQWVLTGRTIAAAVGATEFREITEATRQKLTVLAETESLPRHLAIVSPTLTPEEVHAIAAVLLAADRTEAGQKALLAFEETAKFDEFPEGADRALNRMRELYELTQK